MQRSRELQVKYRVVFGQHVLAIGLLSHFDIRNEIATLLEVAHLRGSVLRSAVQHCDWNNRGQATSDSAGEEQVEAWLVARFHAIGCNIEIRRFMPRID